MNIAIIPARSGSKRIKNKNIRLFHKKPIIYYSILAAKRSKIFDKIYVSTNSKKIKNISKRYGAEILNRPNNFLSGDKAGIVEVISYETKKLKKKIKKNFNVCCIFPASPLIIIKDLIKGYKLIKKNKFEYVFSTSNVNTNVERAFEISKKSYISKIKKRNMNKRSQLLKEKYFDLGQFYWASSETWIRKKNIFSKKAGVVKVDSLYSIDINNINDFKKSEQIYKLKLLNEKN